MVACGPAVEIAETQGGSSSSGPSVSTTGVVTTTAIPTSSTGPVSTTGIPPGTTTGGGSSTGGSTGGAPTSVCDPQPASTNAFVDLIDPGTKNGLVLVDELCTVEGLVDVAGEWQMTLSCPVNMVSPLLVLTIRSDPWTAIDTRFQPGQVIDTRIARSFPIDFGGYVFIALRDPSGDLILGQYGYGTPPAEVDVSSWFAPVAFGPIDGLCADDLWEDPNPGGGGFISDPCPSDMRRMAIDFFVGASSTRIFDRNRGSAGRYDIHVGAAFQNLPIDGACDEPDSTAITWTALPLID